MIQNAKVIGENIKYEVYSKQVQGVTRGHREYVMRRSSLAKFVINPAKWKKSKESDEGTKSTDWGTLIDTLVLTPEEFDEVFKLTPATYTNSKKEIADWTWRSTTCTKWRDDWIAKGFRVVTPDDLDLAKQAIKEIDLVPEVASLLKCSKRQVMVVGEWKDKATGLVIPVRSLIDLVPDKDNEEHGKRLGDWKTARNGNPKYWDGVCEEHSYDIQAALSLDLYKAATKEDRQDWVTPIQENTHPWHVTDPMPALKMEFVAWGRVKYEEALRVYCQCLHTGKWPSYAVAGEAWGGVQYIGPDRLWAYRESTGQGQGRLHEFERPKAEPEETEGLGG